MFPEQTEYKTFRYWSHEAAAPEAKEKTRLVPKMSMKKKTHVEKLCGATASNCTSFNTTAPHTQAHKEEHVTPCFQMCHVL